MLKMMTVSTDVREGIKTVMTDSAQNDGEKAPGTTAVLLQAKGLTLRTRAGENLLSDISFHIEPGELVALTGMSGSGKSSLLQSLAGLMEPSSGDVLIDGINLYANLNAFRSTIGFVPIDYALPQNLTVTEILQDAATLRLPRRATSLDRKERVLTLLQTVGLTQVKDRRVGSLSKFEKRKLSIAVELISYPGLLLIDGSAEPLAPFEEVQIIILLRELSRHGITIIVINERSRSVGLADKIIFLAPGGLLAWFGPADATFAYLKGLLPRGVVKDLFGLQEALEILVHPQPRDGIEWAKRFMEDPAYQNNVDDPLQNRYPDLLLQTRPLLRLRLRQSSKERLPPPIIPRASGLQKLFLLIRRNSRLLWRERMGFMMLAIPVLVALVTFVLSSITTAGTPFGDPNSPAVVSGLFVFLVLMTAALLVQNEIFKERAVYQRESRTSPMLLPYILSKVWLVGILAIYQGLIWTIVHFFAETERAGGLQGLLPYGITLFLIAFIGGILGLMVSALSGTAMTTSSTSWVLLLTIPQFLLLLGPINYWPQLAMMSLFLILVLIGIKHRAGAVRT
jgi:ABC-type multidrug transport system ATPase subunit